MGTLIIMKCALAAFAMMAVVAANPTEVNVPALEDIGDFDLMVESTQTTEEPLNCQTICRPITPSGNSTDDAAFLEYENSNGPAGVSATLVQKAICEGKGGVWTDTNGCAEFMRATTGKVTHSGLNIWYQCQSEMGSGYVPCSPFQALALGHLYKIPHQKKFWLWPGGSFEDAVHDHSTHDEMCKDNKKVGFMSDPEAKNVDSWSCMEKKEQVPVLCCRRG